MLIERNEFVGLENITHLATGGESPPLRSHQDAVARFFADKALGEVARERLEQTYGRCKEKAAQLLSVTSDEIAFLSSASEGINLVAHAMDWQPGDNVVVVDVEFPSDVLPWTRFADQGVEVRVVRHEDWRVELNKIEEMIDERTRVVAISHVSYFTGQRLDLSALSIMVRRSNALLLVDATHSAGAVKVDARYADILVSSCYKWLLGVHGAAVFYWNRERLPDLQPPFLGWNSSLTISDWENPTEYTLRPDADRFVPGNPSFISLYVLENALDLLLELGMDIIEEYTLMLSEQIWIGLNAQGWEVMTPRYAECRAGNICFVAPDIEAVTSGLAQHNILIWGSYGGVSRVRVSTHLHNYQGDVARFLAAMALILDDN